MPKRTDIILNKDAFSMWTEPSPNTRARRCALPKWERKKQKMHRKCIIMVKIFRVRLHSDQIKINILENFYALTKSAAQESKIKFAQVFSFRVKNTKIYNFPHFWLQIIDGHGQTPRPPPLPSKIWKFLWFFWRLWVPKKAKLTFLIVSINYTNNGDRIF